MLLPLSLPVHFTEQDFFESPINREALQWIRAWPHWPSHGLIIYGPKACGKTHLSYIFEYRTHALRMSLPQNEDEGHLLLNNLAANPVCVLDDVDAFLHVPSAASFLFHFYNLLQEKKGSFLLLMETPPAHLEIPLPDLSSRLRSLPAISVGQPDDALLVQVMTKLFADLQLEVTPAIIDYLLHHMERSFAGARTLIHGLNRRSLQEKRPMTLEFCRKFLCVDGSSNLE